MRLALGVGVVREGRLRVGHLERVVEQDDLARSRSTSSSLERLDHVEA
jgi:hypothetical protein